MLRLLCLFCLLAVLSLQSLLGQQEGNGIGDVFATGAQHYALDLSTHFGSGDNETEAGILLCGSYAKMIYPGVSVGGGVGLLTIKAGSKERMYPLFGRVTYQPLNRVSASLNVGYALAGKGKSIIESKGGLHLLPSLQVDLVAPNSNYTSRIGIGYLRQNLNFLREDVITGFTALGEVVVLSEFVRRQGGIDRFVVTFTHAWRVPPQR